MHNPNTGRTQRISRDHCTNSKLNAVKCYKRGIIPWQWAQHLKHVWEVFPWMSGSICLWIRECWLSKTCRMQNCFLFCVSAFDIFYSSFPNNYIQFKVLKNISKQLRQIYEKCWFISRYFKAFHFTMTAFFLLSGKQVRLSLDKGINKWVSSYTGLQYTKHIDHMTITRTHT